MRRRAAHHVAQRWLPAAVPWASLVLLASVGAVYTARLRRALRQAERARDQITEAAHDLKTPLTVMRGEAQFLRLRLLRRPATPIEQRARLLTGLTRIDAAAGTMVGLLNELLDAVRLQAGEPLHLVMQPTDLVALARRGATAAQTGTEEHQIVVQADVPALVGQWDAARLERVLDNLLSNAVKYSPEGGEIAVGIRRAAGWAILSVRDQGIGIPVADQRRIFHPYARGTNVIGALPGSGLGLAGARRTVEDHGGTITVESVEGQGSTFTVRLPLPAVAQPAQSTSPAPEVAGP